MKLTPDSHAGIRLQTIYARQPATEQSFRKRAYRLEEGASQQAADTATTLLELIRLSPVDEVFGLNCRKKTYVVTKRAKEVIDAIAVSKPLPMSRLLPLLKEPRCICLTQDSAFFLWAADGTVKACLVEQDNPHSTVGTISCDLGQAYELLSVFDDTQEPTERGILTLVRGFVQIVTKVLIFLELTNPEILVVAPGKKHSQAPIGYTNTAARSVFVVDSTWNKFIVRTEGFGVRGHFRVQPCGVRNEDLRLVWISAFEKKGYVRRPKGGAGNAPGGPA
jgi:hypothetical protein